MSAAEEKDPPNLYTPGWNDIDGKRYYADEQGKLVSGWFFDQGKRYYLNPNDGNAVARGFISVLDSIYYFRNDGALFDAGWLLDEGTWFYASSSGKIETGWLKLDGTWYYLDPIQGGAMLVGSYKVGSTFYHAYPSGALAVGNG